MCNQIQLFTNNIKNIIVEDNKEIIDISKEYSIINKETEILLNINYNNKKLCTYIKN